MAVPGLVKRLSGVSWPWATLFGVLIGASLVLVLSRGIDPRAVEGPTAIVYSASDRPVAGGWRAANATQCAGDVDRLTTFAIKRDEFLTVPELARGFPCCAGEAFEPLVSLDDVVVVVLTSSVHRERTRVAQLTWARAFPNVVYPSDEADAEYGMVTTPELVGKGSYQDAGRRQLAYLQYLQSQGSPLVSKPFFLLTDDDTFVNWSRLQRLATTLNPACPSYAGYVWDDIWLPGKNFPSGGAGFLVTQECMRRVLPVAFTDGCKYPGVGDVFFMECAVLVGCQIVHSSEFHPRAPPVAMDRIVHSEVADAVTFHYVTSEQAYDLYAFLRDRPASLPLMKL